MERACLPVIVMLLLSGCAGLTARAYIPPDEFLHPFDGTTLVMAQNPHSSHLSQSETKPTLHMCLIRLPDIEARLRQCLFLIELAGCNGAYDVNADPERRLIPAGYERTCASRNWSSVYEKLANDRNVKWLTEKP